jgi:hypothetical protein
MAKSKEANRRTSKSFTQQLIAEIFNLDDKLAQWQFHYNYFRPQSSLGGKTPTEFATEHSAKAPFWD